MKNQYIVGIITGASLMLALFVFIGSGKRDVGRYQAFTSDGAARMIDTKTGEGFRMVRQESPIERLKRIQSQKKDSPLQLLKEYVDKQSNELNLVWVSFVKLPSNDK